MAQEEQTTTASSWRNHQNNNQHNNSHSSSSSNGGGLPLIRSPSTTPRRDRPRPPPITSSSSAVVEYNQQNYSDTNGSSNHNHNQNNTMEHNNNNNSTSPSSRPTESSSFFDRQQQQQQQQQQQRQRPPPKNTTTPYYRWHNNNANVAAMSRAETIILSSSGDVLVCRCRHSPYPAQHNAASCSTGGGGGGGVGGGRNKNGGGDAAAIYPADACHQNEVAMICCDVGCDDLSATVQDTADICSPWSSKKNSRQQQQSSVIPRQRSAVPLRSSSMSFPVRKSRSTGSNNSANNSQTSTSSNMMRGGGLLGGAPAEVAPSPLHFHHQNNVQKSPHQSPHGSPAEYNSPDRSTPPSGGGGHANGNGNGPSSNSTPASFADRAQQAFRSPPISNMESPEDEESIVPIRSFDYSHFYDGGNDMLPLPPPPNSPEQAAARRAAYNNNISGGGGAGGVNTAARIPQSTSSNVTHNNSYYYTNQNNTNMDPSRASAAAAAAASVSNKALPALQHHQFAHGVPSFLPPFSYVKVTKVSAHPLGSHVLLISDAGLLYSYGLNDFGQLGIGLTTPKSGYHGGYVMTPTIVTPLIENGGKAISCAAGVTHSLVVVSTEERRLIKSQSSKKKFDVYQVTPTLSAGGDSNMNVNGSFSTSAASTSYSTEAIAHHQMYGFGRNDYMKIGLVSAKLSKEKPENGLEMEVVKLPRRVALRCKVKPAASMSTSSNSSFDVNMPPPGIFAIAASAEHSAALVRRASGDVELYTWGNAMHGGLGLPQHPTVGGMDNHYPHHHHPSYHGKPAAPLPATANGDDPLHAHHATAAVRVAPVPSFVASLSRTSNADVQVSSLLLREHGEYPCAIALGRRCSFITTSLGRCFSFGESSDGMLGHGQGVTEMHTPSEIGFPGQDDHDLVSVSAGACHVVAVTKSGKAYGWGLRLPAGLAKRPEPKPKPTMTNPPTPVVVQPKKKMPLSRVTPMPDPTEIPEPPVDHQPERAVEDIAWSPEPVTIRADRRVFQSRRNLNKRNPFPRQQHGPERVVEVCAGYDSSLFVGESGLLFSCGRSSGRLGLGEQNNNAYSPRPLFGGLRLWKDVRPPPVVYQQHTTRATSTVASASAPSSPIQQQHRRNSFSSVTKVLSRMGGARSSSAGTAERRKKAPPMASKTMLRRGKTLG